MSYYPIVAGAVLVLFGILGWIFREGFDFIPTYHLVIDIILGLVGLVIGFAPKKSSGSGPPEIRA
ncbi:MAG: hypothetical protein COT91_03010 [Candidatus Doudnabacteria bacterium CG10_big_fil_rev_8_21_14_0_10_41_10]|uniref:Uncharacterized protein n=1 Tax=Candidatus Doudnabacteria bacterium CG10_big_fil_rev_8_21_14_0_10_41_10 TaxID=1974551 RepID=A0A2H0VFU0_9BACT|nr:MAG: hypothetical protein COT91_03010 [Candidatus Doudnabacteria bacterium CG10_big_fil_rev_8_21_14_0_10_41_10]